MFWVFLSLSRVSCHPDDLDIHLYMTSYNIIHSICACIGNTYDIYHTIQTIHSHCIHIAFTFGSPFFACCYTHLLSGYAFLYCLFPDMVHAMQLYLTPDTLHSLGIFQFNIDKYIMSVCSLVCFMGFFLFVNSVWVSFLFRSLLFRSFLHTWL